MNKTIIIAALAIISALSLIYAFVQQAEAEKQRAIAVQYEHKATLAIQIAEDCKVQNEETKQALAASLAASEAQRTIAARMYEEAKAEDEAMKKARK